ncbi:MAG: response regulator [Bacteroidota bacterium]
MMDVLFLIDDDQTYVKILTQYLKDEFDVRVFHNAEDCLEALTSEKPQWAIIDYQLPGMNGLELFKHLRSYVESDKLIVLSSNDDPKVILDMIRQGVQSYVVKDEQVIESLQAAIEGELEF